MTMTARDGMTPCNPCILSLVANAAAAPGGHLVVHHRGYTLHFAKGVYLAGFDVEPIKHACIEQGVVVLDVRPMNPAVLADLDFRNPFVPAGQSPQLFIGRVMSSEVVALLARSYRHDGAEISNLRDPDEEPPGHRVIVADRSPSEARQVS